MKSIYMRNLCKGFFKRKKRIVVAWLIIVLLFGALGVVKAYPEKLSSSVSSDVEEYNAALQKYDDTIQEVQKNIELCQEQVDKQQKYCDESIYMQLDPNNIQKVTIQFMVSINDMDATDTVSYISNALMNYIAGDGMASEIAEELGDISEEYLRELISCQVSANIVKVYVIHSDMDQAKSIAEKIEDKVDAYKNTVEEELGDFTLSIVEFSEATVADISVQDKQNTNLNNLKNYQSSLTDHETKLVSQQTIKKNYISQYKPDEISSSSPKKTIVEYGALGVIAGIVLPFVIYALWYTMSGRVKGKEELLAADINVLATYSEKKGYEPSIARTALDLKLLAEKNDKEKLWVKCLGNSENIAKVTDELKADILKQGLTMEILEDGKETIDQLQNIVENGNMILVAEAGTTNYTQVEEQLQFCERFNVSVWGCIVIE